MKRSETTYPLMGIDLAGGLKNAWEKGWLDEFSNDHFLIKAIEKRLEYYPRLFTFSSQQMSLYQITINNFQENFCINFSFKLKKLIDLFGECNMYRFFTDQLSAGKKNYDEDQFFRAMSEVSVLSFFASRADSGEYEPETNGKKNPEARLKLKNGSVVDIEVKTPGFNDFKGIKDIVIPTVLLDDQGRLEFMSICESYGLNGAMPRVMKIKDFLNSAAEKFENVDHVQHMNLLYINWSFSEFEESGYQEAFSLMANEINGILVQREIGISLGIHDDVYDKITAVVVYTESLQGMMFGELRYIWINGYDKQPQFGIIGMHNCDNLYKVTGMNPYAEQLTPVLTGILRNTKCVDELMALIDKHMLVL